MKFLRTKFLKSILIATLIVAAPIFVRAESAYEAMSKDKNMVVHSTWTIGVLTSTNVILIDLSSTTIFPHMETGEIDISRIELYVDKLAASSGTVKIGVVDAVNFASGTVTYFGRNSFEKNVSNANPWLVMNLEDSVIKTHANPPAPGGNIIGATPFIYSNDRTQQSTTFQNDVNLPTPNGNAAPGVGDIVMYAANNDFTNTINVIATIYYHSHQRK